MDFGLLDSRIVREYISVGLSHQLRGNLLWKPQEPSTAENVRQYWCITGLILRQQHSKTSIYFGGPKNIVSPMWHPWYCFIFANLSIPAIAEVYSDINRGQQCSAGRPHFNYISCPLGFLCLQEFLSHSDPHSNLEFRALAGTSLP